MLVFALVCFSKQIKNGFVHLNGNGNLISFIQGQTLEQVMECMHNITLNMVSFDHLKNCLAMREVDFVLAIEFLASKMLQ